MRFARLLPALLVCRYRSVWAAAAAAGQTASSAFLLSLLYPLLGFNFAVSFAPCALRLLTFATCIASTLQFRFTPVRFVRVLYVCVSHCVCVCVSCASVCVYSRRLCTQFRYTLIPPINFDNFIISLFIHFFFYSALFGFFFTVLSDAISAINIKLNAMLNVNVYYKYSLICFGSRNK